MRAFFTDKFERDHYQNLALIKIFEQQEDQLSQNVLRSFSHILNVHYLWNCRLKHISADSNDWDILPLSYFMRFEYQNYQETRDLLAYTDWEEMINYHSSEGIPLSGLTTDILYHILQHSTYHRAQIIAELKGSNLQIPSFEFVLIRPDKVTK
jgi:uncharacterized damage-inducible protein DinB